MLRYLGMGWPRWLRLLRSPIHPSFEFPPVSAASLRFANGAVGKLSALLDDASLYSLNSRLFGTSGFIQDNRVYSSKHYPGAHEYWSFPTISPNSGDVSRLPIQAEIITWSSASKMMLNHIRRSMTATNQCPSVLPLMNRQAREGSR